jgi:hypothetical protein
LHNEQFCHHPTGLFEPHHKYCWSFLPQSRSAHISSTWYSVFKMWSSVLSKWSNW